MESKSNHILRKIIEKFYEGFIDDQEFSDGMKKERLLNICNKLKPPSTGQAFLHDDHHVGIMLQLSQ